MNANPQEYNNEDAAEDGGMAGGLIALPGYAEGGHVEKTGIALVHEGEYILPAPGSAARITAEDAAPGGTVVNYYFPIEIEVVGSLNAAQLRRVADFVYEELDAAFGGQTG